MSNGEVAGRLLESGLIPDGPLADLLWRRAMKDGVKVDGCEVAPDQAVALHVVKKGSAADAISIAKVTQDPVVMKACLTNSRSTVVRAAIDNRNFTKWDYELVEIAYLRVNKYVKDVYDRRRAISNLYSHYLKSTNPSFEKLGVMMVNSKSVEENLTTAEIDLRRESDIAFWKILVDAVKVHGYDVDDIFYGDAMAAFVFNPWLTPEAYANLVNEFPYDGDVTCADEYPDEPSRRTAWEAQDFRSTLLFRACHDKANQGGAFGPTQLIQAGFSSDEIFKPRFNTDRFGNSRSRAKLQNAGVNLKSVEDAELYTKYFGPRYRLRVDFTTHSGLRKRSGDLTDNTCVVEAAELLAATDSPLCWSRALACRDLSTEAVSSIIVKLCEKAEPLWEEAERLGDQIWEAAQGDFTRAVKAFPEGDTLKHTRKAIVGLGAVSHHLIGAHWRKITGEQFVALTNVMGPLYENSTTHYFRRRDLSDPSVLFELTGDQIIQVLTNSPGVEVAEMLVREFINSDNVSCVKEWANIELLTALYNPANRTQTQRPNEIFQLWTQGYVIPAVRSVDGWRKLVESTLNANVGPYDKFGCITQIPLNKDYFDSQAWAPGAFSSRNHTVESVFVRLVRDHGSNAAADQLGPYLFSTFQSKRDMYSGHDKELTNFVTSEIQTIIGNDVALWERALIILDDFPGSWFQFVRLLKAEAKLTSQQVA